MIRVRLPGDGGYEEGGQLTERVNGGAYSSFDSTKSREGAPRVFKNILLRFFEDGQLTDGGQHVSLQEHHHHHDLDIGARH